MTRSTLRTFAAAAAIVCCGALCVQQSLGGGFFARQRSVGGVAVDAEGVVFAPTVEDQQELDLLRAKTTPAVPEAMEELTEMRAVSLKQLEAAIAKSRESGQPLPEEVKFVAGLLRVQYVFVYPERHDIVIAGPAEGWKIDALGNAVGLTTNRPVILLDDLMVALRSGVASRMEPISCSIDPTPEGLQRLQQVTSRMRTIGDPTQTMSRIEEALGPQVISVTGVPGDCHFSRVMVAADFRMKRIAMDFEAAPVDGLPSFLSMMSGRGSVQQMMPRWWLAPKYDPLAKSADGLAWELRGPGVQCMTEQDFVDASGQKTDTRPASPVAQKWASMLTDKFSELADHDSSFGSLRNIIDLAVVGALIEKEQLREQAG
ncbi:MAG: DUF1598 domain-containing protein, partial [Planctomycetales bacterium]|nr:DUF1598 domain-containing protein [Planctomycetales bacterium]